MTSPVSKSKLNLSILFAACLTFSISCGGGSTKKTAETPTPTPTVTSTPAEEKTSTVNMESTGDEATLQLNADSDSGKAGALKTVHFDYNSAVIRSDAKTVLKENADFLKANETVEVKIEGHCDERGSVQYNLALGENRAKSVKSYLTALGIAAKRMSTISYGKERPVDFGHDETAWSKNRRGNFVITAIGKELAANPQ